MKIKIRNLDALDSLNEYQKKLISNIMDYQVKKTVRDEDGNEVGENIQTIEAYSLEDAQAEVLFRQDIVVSEV